MGRKEKLNAAYSIITGDTEKATRAATSKPLGVVLTAEQITRLDQIAADLQTNRHKVLQYAVGDLSSVMMLGKNPKCELKLKKYWIFESILLCQNIGYFSEVVI